MNKIIKVLVERDGMRVNEAKDYFEDVFRSIETAIMDGDYDSVEETMTEELGLEMDYLFDVLGY